MGGLPCPGPLTMATFPGVLTRGPRSSQPLISARTGAKLPTIGARGDVAGDQTPPEHRGDPRRPGHARFSCRVPAGGGSPRQEGVRVRGAGAIEVAVLREP